MHTISFLLSADAASKRMIARKPKFVVHVETCGDIAKAKRFVELDADDAEMASNIADAWVFSMGNASAAIRRVMRTGELHKPSKIVG